MPTIFAGTVPTQSRTRRYETKALDALPGPGPADYASRPHEYTPTYTMRLKLASELEPPPYPGPGHYDVNSGTIGNWGAGMAAHVPKKPDPFLLERIEAFARQDPTMQDEFLQESRMKLKEMRKLLQGTSV